jgi:hypothetical protein
MATIFSEVAPAAGPSSDRDSLMRRDRSIGARGSTRS